MSIPLYTTKQLKLGSGGIDISDYLDESNAFEEAQKFFQSSKPSTIAAQQSNNELEKQKKRRSQYGGNSSRLSVIKDGKILNKNIENDSDNEESLIDIVKGRLKATNSKLNDEKNKIINNLVSKTHIGGMGLVHEEEEMEKLLELESQLKAESSRLEAERQEIAISLRSQKREQIEALEKSVQDDVLELEMNRREIEKDLEKKKITIEKLHSELQETDVELDLSNKSLNSKVKDRINPKDNKEKANSRIKEAFDLAQEYVEILAESKAKVSVANDEMKLIQQGRVPIFDNINNRNADSNNMQNKFIDKPIEAIDSSTSSLQDQIKRIEALKESAAKEAESLKEIDLKELESYVSVPNEESTDVTKILGDLKEGNVSATDYLNNWLSNTESTSESYDRASKTSTKRFSSSKSNSNNVTNINKDQILPKIRDENSLLKAETLQPNDEIIRSEKTSENAESNALRSMIQQLNDEIKQLKEKQSQQSTTNNVAPPINPNPQIPFNPYNPYNPYNPVPNQYGQLPYIPNNFPNNMMYPNMNMGAGQFPHIPQDPTQMMMFQQIQKMVEQMEKENSRLMSQLNGLNPQVPPNNGVSLPKDVIDDGNLPMSNRFHRIESKHHEEIRLMKLEMEKLKQQQELEDLKVQIEKHREERLADLEHAKWLAQQKKDLQELKMKQALAKEEKLLNIVKQDTKKETGKLNPLLVEEAGVGAVLLPFDVIKGTIVAVDCLYLPKGLQEGHSFRIAAAIYDPSGKNITKLVASEWQEWDKSQSNDASSLQFINNPLKRSAKIDDKQPLILNSKVLIEIQVKPDKDTSAQKSMGWSTMRVVGPNPPDSTSNYLFNGLWRIPILSGQADPAVDPFSINSPSSAQQRGFLFIRVADSNNTVIVNTWAPKLAFTSNNSLDPMQVYLDPKQYISDEHRPSSARPPTSSRPPTSQSIKASRPGTAIKSMPEAQSMLAIDETPEEEDDQLPLNKKDDAIPWLLGTPSGPAVEKYQPGDGIDIYVDSAMFLPDNCTISRVVVKLFTSEKELIGNVYEGYSILTSPNISPVFKQKVELRASGNLNTTATALIRFDTIDVVTLQPSSVGYACIKLFCSQDRKQCTAIADPEAFVNTGLFQLPIKAGRIPPLESFSDEMLKSLTRVPCATVLVRIIVAPKSGDGLTVLSKEDFPREEWGKLKLDIAAPPYNSGAYDGILAEPTPIDRACYIAKSTCPIESVETVLGHTTLMDGDKSSNIPKISASASTEDKSEWIKSVLPPSDQMRKLINFSYTAPYSVDSGIAVNILSLYNVPDGSGFLSNDAIIYKVIYSMTPPGLYYKEPPLSEGVKFTRLHDFEKPGKAPVFSDGAVIFTPNQMEESLYLLLDIRTLKLDTKNPKDDPIVVVEPPVPKKSYWTLLPIAKERTRGQGFIYTASGLYQLPLFEGPVPKNDDIFNTTNPLAETIARLESKGNKTIKLSEGSCLLVKIGNPLLKDVLTVDPGIDSPDNLLQTGLLERLIKASNKGNFPVKKNIFNYDKNNFSVNNGFKSTQQLMPKSVDTKKIQKILNKSFATALNLVE